MQGTVAVTDFGWYNFLRGREVPEVNFWTPSDRRGFHAPVFSLFFFKLKAPHNAICGFGYFTRWASLPDWLAWDCFQEGNGCHTLSEMRERIGAIRQRIRYDASDGLHNIGCIILAEPIFFSPEEWIPQPADWHVRIVSSKSYDLASGEGLKLWQACQERAAAKRGVVVDPGVLADPSHAPRYGAQRFVAPRLGQGAFRISVTEAYGRACAVTGEHSLPVLDAAHVQSYAQQGPHEVQNGILLRADVHRLFDQGYVTVAPDYRVEVSARLRADYSNGRSYYPLQGRRIQMPSARSEQPAAKYLQWHNEHVYLG